MYSLTLIPDSFPKCIFWEGLEKSILWGGLYYSSGLKESRKLQYSLWDEYTYSNFSCTQQFHINNFIYTTLSKLLSQVTLFQQAMKCKHLLLQFPMACRINLGGCLLVI